MEPLELTEENREAVRALVYRLIDGHVFARLEPLYIWESKTGGFSTQWIDYSGVFYGQEA